jgi:hypothetical protein
MEYKINSKDKYLCAHPMSFSSHHFTCFFHLRRLLLLDDDNIPQAHLVLTALWRAWHDSLRGSVSGVGIPVGVKAINPPTRGAFFVVVVAMAAMSFGGCVHEPKHLISVHAGLSLSSFPFSAFTNLLSVIIACVHGVYRDCTHTCHFDFIVGVLPSS